MDYMKPVNIVRLLIYIAGIAAILTCTYCVTTAKCRTEEVLWPPDFVPHPHPPGEPIDPYEDPKDPNNWA
jgi:hypothetical protein